MLRIVSTAIRDTALRNNVVKLTNSLIPKQFPIAQCIQQRFFGAFSSTINNSWDNISIIKPKEIFGQTQINNVVSPTLVPAISSVRTITKFSGKKGKRTTAKTVLTRFYRLNWGMWIRPRSGRKKSLWKKAARRRNKLKQHVFCNATQCTMLDKMVTKYWKRPHYYVDDPYTPYHKREEYPFTRKKPQPF